MIARDGCMGSAGLASPRTAMLPSQFPQNVIRTVAFTLVSGGSE